MNEPHRDDCGETVPANTGPTGTLYGFAERCHPTVPAAAQEPPWVMASNAIFHGCGGYGESVTAIIRVACERHAAALAQERDVARQQYGAMVVIADELRATVAHLNMEKDYLHRVLNNREKSLKQAGDDWVKAKTELDTAQATVARLTAERDKANELLRSEREQHAKLGEEVVALVHERDKAIAALRAARRFVDNAIVDTPEERFHQHGVVAQIDAALSSAPDAKEGA